MKYFLVIISNHLGHNTFEVISHFREPLEDSIIKIDYHHTPWPRIDGNLLWQ